MSVVNCKVKFIRPQYNNLKEWMDDDNNVYIGRAGVVFIQNDETNKKERFPKLQSLFANPFKVGKDGTREEVIAKYRDYIEKELETSPVLVTELISMKGKNLGCWCHPEPCHGDVLLELIEKYYKKKHEFMPPYDHFHGKCNACYHHCNELSGWKCVMCGKCYCDDHNDDEFTCECEYNSDYEYGDDPPCKHESSTKIYSDSSIAICDDCGEEIEI